MPMWALGHAHVWHFALANGAGLSPKLWELNLFEHVQKLFYLAVPFLQFALLINKHHKHKFSKKRGFAFKSFARHQGNALPTKNWRRTCRVHQECATIAQRWDHEWAVLKRSLIYCRCVILPPPHHSQRFWDCSACLRACITRSGVLQTWDNINIYPPQIQISNVTVSLPLHEMAKVKRPAYFFIPT